ncbi:hypothetical protein F5I97DRAFT_1813835 [Phlebopus sp. FC_14]|nr:hypothetical protein F5I97DRAFT_1813835 [Phlebopus sp. FC_14]
MTTTLPSSPPQPIHASADHHDTPNDADLETCRAMQEEEWQVLGSIHPTICISNDILPENLDTCPTRAIKLEIPIELGEDRVVEITSVSRETYYRTRGKGLRWNERSLDASDSSGRHTANLATLPALRLHTLLPMAYPLHTPPLILSLQATAAWVPRSTLMEMRGRMVRMCRELEGSGVLYTWVEWIRTGEFLTDVGMVDEASHSVWWVVFHLIFPTHFNTTSIPHPSPAHLLPVLLTYASSVETTAFADTSHACIICLGEYKGRHCVRLECGHVFCRGCLVEMWGLHVKEGDVERVGCPDVSCAQEKEGMREAVESEVRTVLSDEEVERWRWLRKKRDLERDPTMIHCPMEFCQEPVPKAKHGDEDEEETGWERLRTCHSCGYTFCALCRRTWHGPHTRCPLPLTSTFILNYLAAAPSSAERLAIERRYGRANVLRLVRQHEEDEQNKKWMDTSTMACPGCEVRVEKSMGCNHMTCAKCKTHFCYRCGSKISAANPYQHFSTRGTSCFSKLFDLEPSADQDWQPLEGFEFV